MWNDMTLNRKPHRAWTMGLVGTSVLVGLLAGVAFGALAPADSSTRKVDSGRGDVTITGADDRVVERLREGTQFQDELGYFKVAGDRLTFYATSGAYRFIALENLNLERISRLVSDSPSELEWSVSGTITEYYGVNFLLLERAVLKSRTSTARPVNP